MSNILSRDEDYTRKVIGIMAISAISPISIIAVPGGQIRLMCGKKVLGDINQTLFAALSAREILKLLSVPIKQNQLGV